MTESESFEHYARSPEGQAFPLGGGPIDEIVRLRLLGKHQEAERLVAVESAWLADEFAAEEAALRKTQARLEREDG